MLYNIKLNNVVEIYPREGTETDTRATNIAFLVS